MKVRHRARLLKRQHSEPRRRGPNPRMQKLLTRLEFAHYISKLTDADLDQALAAGKANGLYDTFRGLRQ